VQKLWLAALFLLLGYTFWVSPDISEIAAGIALFLFGMRSLETGFQSFTGGPLETALRRSTSRLWKAIGFGVATTTVMQSSTLISLLTISFVSAEMITLAGGIGIIMGANLGTTTGAWLIAGFGLRVDIAAYAMPMLVFGVILLINKSRTLKGLGYLLLGLAFLFLGIHFMKEGFEPFQARFDLAAYSVGGLTGVLLFTLIGMLATFVMQSSHATILLIIAALATGQVSYENALALAIGANLGTAGTTAIGGLMANVGGRRLAAAHVLFNVLTAAAAIALIQQMAWTVDWTANLIGIPEDDYLLKLALFHTLFNLLGVIMLAPFVGVMERLLIRHITYARQPTEQPRFLYPEALKTPATATAAVRNEIGHLYDNAYGLIALGIGLRRSVIDSGESLAEAVQGTRRLVPLDLDEVYESKIKSLHSAIMAFIAEIQQSELAEQWTQQLNLLQQASHDIVEAVKATKHLRKNLTRHGTSPDLAIRERYDALRLQIAKLLHEIQKLRTEEPGAVTSLSLDPLRLSLQTSHRRNMDDINQMIRSRRLTPYVATSIINDAGYAFGVGENLIEASRALLIAPEHAERMASERLMLDEQELARIANAARSAAYEPNQRDLTP
jgi:phosphate:Na+ symporter